LYDGAANVMSSPPHHFIIEPFKGVGPISFGMHKDEVSHAFTYLYRSFFKGGREVRSDQCEVVGLTIHYDAGSRVESIEVDSFQPANVGLELFGRQIRGISIRDAFKLLSSQSKAYTKNEFGYAFPELGISTFNHDFGSEKKPVEWFGLEPKAPVGAA
jgi:hypothetical protein